MIILITGIRLEHVTTITRSVAQAAVTSLLEAEVPLTEVPQEEEVHGAAAVVAEVHVEDNMKTEKYDEN